MSQLPKKHIQGKPQPVRRGSQPPEKWTWECAEKTRVEGNEGTGLPEDRAGSGRWLTPVAYGAQAPVEFGACGFWAWECCREAATRKFQAHSEGLGQATKAALVAAKPRASSYLVILCPELDTR